MKLIISTFFLFGFLTFNCQEVNSIFVYKKEKKIIDKTKNFAELDSLVLYKDSSFKKYYRYYGFCEISKFNYSGTYSIKNKHLTLVFKFDGKDSLSNKNFKIPQIIYKLKSKKLIPLNKDFLKLQKM